MFRSLLTLAALLLGLHLCAAPIDEAQARQIAAGWWQSDARRAHGVQSAPRLAARCGRAWVFGRGTAFLLVARDDRDPQILGYGEGDGSGEMPPVLKAVLSRSSSEQVRASRAAVYPPQGAQGSPVAPLLTTVRHQGDPYNRACPYYRDTDGTLSAARCKVGCVATAMEQILTYHRRLYTLADTLHGWENEHYAIPDILPGTAVDSRLILDNYADSSATEAETDAVTRLSYYLGVACHMNWGVNESGANSWRLIEPLQRAFGLKYVHYLNAWDYAPADWWNFLAAEIHARRPVYYAGYIMQTGGHAFVLDGLDGDGLFHVNWGYGGNYDGFFRLDVLFFAQPEADRLEEAVETGFFTNHEAIALSPDSVDDAQLPDTLARTGREVEVEGISVDKAPLTGCYTPVRLFLHNTASAALTTSFALLLNEPADTSRFAQAEWIAYTGRTLEAGQRDTLLVHARFTREGRQLLSVTPDGEQTLDSLWVDVASGGSGLIDCGEPEVSLTDATTAEVSLTFRNPDPTARAAEFFYYELADTLTQADRQIEHCVYLDPLADTTETVRFRRLTPGRTYELRIRRYWPVVRSLTFAVPDAEGVEEAETDAGCQPVEWFTPDGRRIARPAARGIYIKKQGRRVRKILF